MLMFKDIDTFTLHIEDGYLCWDVKLKDGYCISNKIQD